MTSSDKLKACQSCGAEARWQSFYGPNIQGEARLILCANSKLLGGDCESDGYLSADVWNSIIVTRNTGEAETSAALCEHGHVDAMTPCNQCSALEIEGAALTSTRPNTGEEVERLRGRLDYICLLASNHGGWLENGPEQLLRDIHDAASAAFQEPKQHG